MTRGAQICDIRRAIMDLVWFECGSTESTNKEQTVVCEQSSE